RGKQSNSRDRRYDLPKAILRTGRIKLASAGNVRLFDLAVGSLGIESCLLRLPERASRFGTRLFQGCNFRRRRRHVGPQGLNRLLQFGDSRFRRISLVDFFRLGLLRLGLLWLGLLRPGLLWLRGLGLLGLGLLRWCWSSNSGLVGTRR